MYLKIKQTPHINKDISFYLNQIITNQTFIIRLTITKRQNSLMLH